MKFHAMNTTFQLAGLEKNQAKRIKNWFCYVENRLSRFKPDSELSALNQSQGKRFLASTLLYEVVEQAARYYKETNHLFHPFLGKNLEWIGYDRSFEHLTVAEDRNELVPPIPGNYLTLHPDMRSISLAPGISVDLGGIAKGWSVGKAQQWLQKEGLASGLIDGGGDIAGWGEEGTWTIGVADPYHIERDLVQLQMKRTFGIATSSTIKRSWVNSRGEKLHHLLDPMTGRPSQSDLVQVTMVAPDVCTAEVYAKTFLLLGLEKGVPLMKKNKPHLAFVTVDQNKEVFVSDNIHDYAIVKGEDKNE
ncbi:FAD:protein FMN transferase [Ammoniphilus resinae]|uniref:FAD:protein FMN transferase n=1 Tax=Ammoniphilus resinae TaxID=861532 RepID=A0ABS4GL88_9BACL|nr:FAD:protein FMN transferase [Ammoniphilus resinae]MBP1931011.1 thiamine biosynthesis lipoprotein [Ammoniphilus resinae]